MTVNWNSSEETFPHLDLRTFLGAESGQVKLPTDDRINQPIYERLQEFIRRFRSLGNKPNPKNSPSVFSVSLHFGGMAKHLNDKLEDISTSCPPIRSIP